MGGEYGTQGSPLGGFAPEEKTTEAWLSFDHSAEILDLGDPWGTWVGVTRRGKRQRGSESESKKQRERGQRETLRQRRGDSEPESQRARDVIRDRTIAESQPNTISGHKDKWRETHK